jgi:hypothetical protein
VCASFTLIIVTLFSIFVAGLEREEGKERNVRFPTALCSLNSVLCVQAFTCSCYTAFFMFAHVRVCASVRVCYETQRLAHLSTRSFFSYRGLSNIVRRKPTPARIPLPFGTSSLTVNALQRAQSATTGSRQATPGSSNLFDPSIDPLRCVLSSAIE